MNLSDRMWALRRRCVAAGVPDLAAVRQSERQVASELAAVQGPCQAAECSSRSAVGFAGFCQAHSHLMNALITTPERRMP
ncbi:hypothetical protein D5S17_14480 [Pseudonocardiaceae bacterium YIM PH 21723]|nr:hypothetical protein D5S17_14480 [Pseudonocardiaceae bacterium YIM PH 21723]